MTFQTLLKNFDGPLWGLHLAVPIDIALALKEKNISRVNCKFNGRGNFNTGLMPDGAGSYFITINKDLAKQLDLAVGMQVEVSLEADDSKYGMPMPEELGELLAQDSIGDKHFHALTPGKQRNLIYMVAKPKRAETRLQKAIVIIDYLKATNGRLDFKELNQAFKDSHNQ